MMSLPLPFTQAFEEKAERGKGNLLRGMQRVVFFYTFMIKVFWSYQGRSKLMKDKKKVNYRV